MIGRLAAPVAVTLGLGLLALPAGGCGQDCCTIDSFPIALGRAPLAPDGTGSGGLLASATSPSVGGPQPFPMLIDTGSAITILAGSSNGAGGLALQHRSFDLLDAGAPPPAPLRAEFRSIGLLDLPLGPAGAAGTLPLAVLGGDVLRSFSVDFRFAGPCPAGAPGSPQTACPSLTFWRHLGASEAFLQDAGFAVLRFPLRGGGETTAQGDPDLFGSRGPLELPATRVVLRACAAPRAFVPTEPRELCCTRGAEITLSTGVDLSLLVATGVGPLVLSQSAWLRVMAELPAPPAMTSAPLLVSTWPGEIAATWSSLPRVALVDLEVGPTADPGPCVELGRARRIEWASFQHVMGPSTDACVQPCDTDPRETDKAQNSAAYLELGGAIPVAVIADGEPFLQALRFDIRPEGPEIDGVIGAGALGPARMEIDYPGNPPRALFSCEPGTARDTCWAAARCPRLPDLDHQHLCFGLGQHGLPASCGASGC